MHVFYRQIDSLYCLASKWPFSPSGCGSHVSFATKKIKIYEVNTIINFILLVEFQEERLQD